MKKIIIYVDWENQEILFTDEDFDKTRERIRQALEDEGEVDFKDFLENNYSAFEIYEMSDRDKIDVRDDFEEWADSLVDDRFEDTYEEVEIEVEE